MDFTPSPEVATLRERVLDFLDEHYFPVEREIIAAIDAEVGPGVPYPANLTAIRAKAREEGLWNLFMPDERFGPGLTNWEYGLICEELGRSPLAAPMVFNCSAPGHRQHGDPRRARHGGAARALAGAAAGGHGSAPASR